MALSVSRSLALFPPAGGATGHRRETACGQSPIETRTKRLKLPVHKKARFDQIAPGISLGYRRNQVAGSWTVRVADGAGSSWTRRIGTADDLEDPDGVHVLSYWEAVDKAKALAREAPATPGARRPLPKRSEITRSTSASAAPTKGQRHRVAPAFVAGPDGLDGVAIDGQGFT